MTMGMKMNVFWDAVPCSLVDADQDFRGPHCLHHQSHHYLDDGGITSPEISTFTKLHNSTPQMTAT
jgi:hypothetical protein